LFCCFSSNVQEALKKGMEEKSKEFAEKGNELYAKAVKVARATACRIGRVRPMLLPQPIKFVPTRRRIRNGVLAVNDSR
jgi:hypothetical protein